MTVSAVKLFKGRFNKPALREVFTTYIAEGSAVGRDGVKLEAFNKLLDAEIDLILRKVQSRKYCFTSYKEKLISKGAGKRPRQLSIPTIRDKLVLKSISRLLADIYPGQVAWVPHSTIKRVHEEARSRPSTDCFLRLDIEDYYPSIDHKILMRILRRKIRCRELLHLIEDAIRTPTGKQKGAGTYNSKGVPQGLSISNILASIYLADIDEMLTVHPVSYSRYVDDILMIGSPSEVDVLEKSVPRLLKQKRKIKCHQVGNGGKSVRVPLAEGIEYLGYRFCGEVLEVRESSLKKMFANIMKAMTGIKYRKAGLGKLIWRLNLRITGCQLNGRRIGWLFFFSQTKNVQQLQVLDAFVAKHAKRLLPAEDALKVRRFVKGYYEIKFHHQTTGYFPNFDNFDDAQKRSHITLLQPKMTAEKLAELTPQELTQLFHKCISHEVADLESDMMEVFS